MAEVPTAQQVRDWAMIASSSLTDDQLQQIIDTEAALQSASCTWLDDYPVALAQAMLRRCAREMAARQLPLGISTDTTGEYGPARLPRWDAEIERLEAPYRVVAVA